MKDGWEYRLLKYTYITYCQGSEDRSVDYALINVPSDSVFNNTRSVLMNTRHREGIYEIDIESVEDLSINW